MTMRAGDLRYPLLCLTRELGVCVVQSAAELERCRAVVYWRGRFYEGLRLVDPNGDTYGVVRATIRKPASGFGQWLARFLDLSISVEVEATRGTPMSLTEVAEIIEKAVDEDAESFEEFSGKSVDFWRQELAESRTIADLMRTLQTAVADG